MLICNCDTHNNWSALYSLIRVIANLPKIERLSSPERQKTKTLFLSLLWRWRKTLKSEVPFKLIRKMPLFEPLENEQLWKKFIWYVWLCVVSVNIFERLPNMVCLLLWAFIVLLSKPKEGIPFLPLNPSILMLLLPENNRENPPFVHQLSPFPSELYWHRRGPKNGEEIRTLEFSSLLRRGGLCKFLLPKSLMMEETENVPFFALWVLVNCSSVRSVCLSNARVIQ